MRRLLGIAATLTVLALPVVGSSPATSSTLPATCMGRTVTMMGTDGPDVLVSQSGVSDVIWGGGDNDSIVGGAFYEDDDIPGRAPDWICGGPGDDQILGGPGNDHINGGDGNDRITAQRGDDVVRGNTGADQIDDDSCNDCDGGKDVELGGPGPDWIEGGWGVDRLEGNGGNDTLWDLECDPDVLLGGYGDDYIESWTSSFDGYGSYTCVTGGYPPPVADTVNGGPGTDSSKDDTADSISNVESTEIVIHGMYG